jgi:hypothetical protein
MQTRLGFVIERVPQSIGNAPVARLDPRDQTII